jgi:hypothetical protein
LIERDARFVRSFPPWRLGVEKSARWLAEWTGAKLKAESSVGVL